MTEAQLLDLVERVRSGTTGPDALVDALREDAPLYAGRSTGTTARLRGWILASFAELGLPARALPFVREELESGIEPFPVAAAARALRGGRRDADVTELLVRAFRNLRTRDEPITFDSLAPTWPARTSTTALREILATAAWVRPSAPRAWRQVLHESSGLETEVHAALLALAERPSCCGGTAHTAEPPQEPRAASVTALAAAIVEDQDGRRTTFAALTLGRPTVLTFFYTRCENPNKCALTIAKLGDLQRWLSERRRPDAVRILALTYDPEFDRPERLRRYALDRGLQPGPTVTLGRLPDAHGAMREHLQLRVGRGGATVNRHAVEVFTLAPDGSVVGVQERRDWDPATVGAAALALA